MEFADQGDVVAGHRLHDVGKEAGIFLQQGFKGSLIQTVEDTVRLCVDAERNFFLYAVVPGQCIILSADFSVVAHQGRSKPQEMIVGEIDKVFLLSVHGERGQAGDAFHQIIDIGVGQSGVADRCLPLHFNSHAVAFKILFYSVLIHTAEALPSICRFSV